MILLVRASISSKEESAINADHLIKAQGLCQHSPVATRIHNVDYSMTTEINKLFSTPIRNRHQDCLKNERES